MTCGLQVHFNPERINVEANPQTLQPNFGPVTVNGTTDYDQLINKPQINGDELHGGNNILAIPDKTSELINDSGFVNASEASAAAPVQSVNGQHGAVQIAVPTALSDLENDSGFITHDEIFTDLGTINSALYEDDVYAYLNTLTDSGWYKFVWGNGDDFTYFVQAQSVEFDGNTFVNQHFWGAEEGASTEYIRGLRIEDGEVVNERTVSYLTIDVANTAFSRVGHSHVRYETKSQSVWDFCDSVAIQNNNPLVIYFDLSTNKTYLIETYMGGHQPVYKMQKVTEMNDTSYFCQRSSYYYSGREHWGSWYKFTGTIFTP